MQLNFIIFGGDLAQTSDAGTIGSGRWIGQVDRPWVVSIRRRSGTAIARFLLPGRPDRTPLPVSGRARLVAQRQARHLVGHAEFHARFSRFSAGL
jgi:hypothetical protein